MIFHSDPSVTLHCGDVREVLPRLETASVQCIVTSPPYWGLRDYGVEGQLGLEPTPELYVARMVEVFREIKRVLRDDGTLWLNLGDSYAANRSYQVPSTKGGPKHAPAQAAQSSNTVPDGLKPKDLIGIPWRVAFALQADGWWLRSDIIWNKKNPMPESVNDRPTKSHEYLFLMTKGERYYYDGEAIREPDAGQDHARAVLDNEPSLEPSGGLRSAHRGIRTAEGRNGSGRNRRSVWTIATEPYPEAHFATFPTDLIKPCVMAGSRVGDVVLDPFAGSGTALYVAKELGRKAVGIELNPKYCALAVGRLRQDVLPL